mmetsp:Transcript_26415/g.61878  ORF Transcript_26415/g.61878 Transcript_26415/m.61878 type:complete len:355 (-) Transcript_26415:87-1151(-)
MSNSTNNSASMSIDKPNQFPWKLYDTLDTAEKRNEEHVISWIRDGKAFKVHHRELFIEEYMKKMFNQTKFKSFQRQLNLWGFERIQNGPDKGSYFHPLFVKGKRECCQRLSRVRLKGTIDKVVQHGVQDKFEPYYSPHSVATTTAESISTTEAATLSLSVSAVPSTTAQGNPKADSPAPLLGAFVDVSQPTSTNTIEPNFQRSSPQSHFSEFLQYHTSERRREMIRNAAIGLSPITVVGSPVFAIAVDTSRRNNDRDDYHQQHQEQNMHQQTHQQPDHLQTLQLQPNADLSMAGRQQQQQQQQQRERQTDLDLTTQTESRGLEALLSVAAIRRREEESALLLSLSDKEGASRTI